MIKQLMTVPSTPTNYTEDNKHILMRILWKEEGTMVVT